VTLVRLHAHAAGDAMRRMTSTPFASLLSLLVLALAIALPVLAATVLRTVGAATSGLDTEPHVNVYMAPEASADDGERVEQALRGNSDVAEVRAVPKAQALEELKATSHLAEILATLDRNPLPDAFTVRLKAGAGDRTPALRDAIRALPKVDQVTTDFEWARRLQEWVRFGERLVTFLAVILAAAVAFIVGHLIRLQAVTRREEIVLSQLVGATAADVRRPLLYHGLLQGLLAGGLAVALAGLIHWLVTRQMQVLAPEYAIELKVLFLPPMGCAAVVASAAALGWAGAWTAAQREIRRFSGG
jgi:cell division transport system permease protein